MGKAVGLALVSAMLGAACTAAAAARPFEVPVGRLALRPLPGSMPPASGVAAYFFAVPIRIGATRLPALLDTGSIGVRVLPRQVWPRDIVSSDDHPETETFGGTTLLTGVAAKARVGLGPFPLSPLVTLQLIRSGTCAPDPADPGKTKPCPLDNERFDQFRFGGQGRPYVGFPAIFGIRPQQPGPQSEVGNPLNVTGHNQYIVDLPRAERDRGSLLVDPGPLQMQGFVQLTHNPGAPNATVRGCLVDLDSKANVCGPMLLDSGAPSISVTPNGAPPAFPRGTHAQIRFVDQAGTTLATESFVVASEPYTTVDVRKADPTLANPYISLGQVPFIGFSVMIDAQAQTIAVKTRPNPPPNGPAATIGE